MVVQAERETQHVSADIANAERVATAEQRRAERAEADAQGLRARELLIQGVTEAARQLLGPGDFEAAVPAALGALGAALAPTPGRVALVEDIAAPSDTGPGRWRVTYEWYRPDLEPQIGSDLESGEYPNREWWERVNAGETVLLTADFAETPGPHKVLTTPVPGPIRRWLTVAFEDLSNKRWSNAELAILQTAAACLGAALQRRDVEADRLQQQRQRTDEALSLSGLLEGVVAASRALLEVADFEDGLSMWLARLAIALEADRAELRGVGLGGGNSGAVRPPVKWAADGGSERSVLDVAEINDCLVQLSPGRAVWFRCMDLRESASICLWEQAGIHSALLMPVFLGASNGGFVAFAWTVPPDWPASHETVLRTAVDGIAAAVKRNDAVDALARERERSANERSAELAKANAGMQRTLARLAASQDIDAFLATALLELHQHARCGESYLFVKDEELGGMFHLRASVRGESLRVESAEDDPPAFASGFQPSERSYLEMLNTGRMIWRAIEPTSESAFRPAAVQSWHQRKGHQGEARYLLQVGDRTAGMVAMAFSNDQPLADGQCELLVALSQPMALALELSRLGEAANRASKEHALLAERNRMARDVHDTLAQGFTAISLQLQAAGLATDALERDRFVALAATEAQSNLAESRRTIRMLRGLGLPSEIDQSLSSLLKDAIASRLTGSDVEWRVVSPPAPWTEPALGDDERRELKRIAQEAATNVLKHARARTFEVSLGIANEKLRASFADDGRGFEVSAQQDGYGLLGMRERAERIGATIRMDSRVGGPTVVTVEVPIGIAGESPR